MDSVLLVTASRLSEIDLSTASSCSQPASARSIAPAANLKDLPIGSACDTSASLIQWKTEADDPLHGFAPIVPGQGTAQQRLGACCSIGLGIEQVRQKTVHRAQGLCRGGMAGCIDRGHDLLKMFPRHQLRARNALAQPRRAAGKMLIHEVDQLGHARGLLAGG